MACRSSGGRGRGSSWFTCFFPSSSAAEDSEDTSGDQSVFIVTADYKRQELTETNLNTGETVTVLQRNPTGWWFVRTAEDQGWVPASYLRPLTGQRDEHRVQIGDSRYVTVQSYRSSDQDEVQFGCGVTVEVIQKNMEGWWFIRYDGQEGWAPAPYLRKLQDDDAPGNQTTPPETSQDTIGQVEIIGNLMEISNLLTRRQDTPPDSASSHSSHTHTEDSCSTHSLSDRSDTHTHTHTPEPTECVSATDISVSVCVSPVQRTHTPAIARVTPQRYHSVENESPSYRERPAPRRENSLGFQLPDPPGVNEEYYTISEFQSCLSDGISFSGGERAEVGDKEGWSPSSYIHKRKKPSLNRKSSTLTRPKVPPPAPPPAPPIKQQSWTSQSRVYEEPEYDVPTAGLEQDRRAGEQSEDDRKCIISGRSQRPVWDPPEYDAPTVELSSASGSQDHQHDGSKPKPSVRPKPTNPDLLRLSLKPPDQHNQNQNQNHNQNHNQNQDQDHWRASAGSDTDSASSLDDSTVFKLSEAEATLPWLSISAEGEITPPPLSEAEATPLRAPVSSEVEATPLRAPVNIEAESEATPLQVYRSTAEFQQGAQGELSLPAGVLVEVLEKQESGWWFVRWGALEGWVPTYYLQPIRTMSQPDAGNNTRRPDQNRGRVTARLRDGGSDNSTLTKNHYASVSKNKNSSAEQNPGPFWKNQRPQLTRRDLVGSGRSVPVSMVKPKPQLIHNDLREEFISLADYSGDSESMSLQAGTRLQVLEKNSTGWWFCCTLDSQPRRGWVPSNFLEKRK